MRTRLTRIGGLMAAALALTLAPATAGAATSAHARLAHTTKANPAQIGPAYFEMTDSTDDRFVIKMTDPEDIQHARQLLSGETNQMTHIFGRIVKRPALYNPGWSFHLEPPSIGFFDHSIEACDASIIDVENHLDEVGSPFLPGSWWCDWSSRLVREIPVP